MNRRNFLKYLGIGMSVPVALKLNMKTETSRHTYENYFLKFDENGNLIDQPIDEYYRKIENKWADHFEDDFATLMNNIDNRFPTITGISNDYISKEV